MKKILFNIAAFVVFMALIFILPDVFDISFVWVYVVAVALYFAATYLIDKYVDNIHSVENLENSIIKKMEGEGYQCEKDDGTLVYMMNGRKYRTHFWEVGNGSFRTKFVDYLIIDDDWNDITNEGKAVLANYVNGRCPHTTFFSTNDGVVCSYIAYVQNSADFIKEAKIGYNIIGEAIAEATDVLPQVKQRYSTMENTNPIGFANK
ncbi:MAG: hypothetical protein J6T86_00395 [Bacteroidales bacterium]|nr:hypothetical protein [Bacteroidales bacterium]